MIPLLARVDKALAIAMQSGGVDGTHHKMWVIDQMVRALTGCPPVDGTAKDCFGEKYSYTTQGESAEYMRFILDHNRGEEGPDTYSWNVGVPP